MPEEKTKNCVVLCEGFGLYEEKRSRFLSELYPVHSEEEALEKVETARKKYYDARHHCFAYVIGRNQDILRASDDGEPQGTAGHPILDVLLGREIHDAVLIVTRYFGGTLLGTGGLVRAYGTSAGDAANHAEILEEHEGISFTLEYEYSMAGKVEYLLRKDEGVILSQAYGERVQIQGLLPLRCAEKFSADLRNESNGTMELSGEKDCCYVIRNGQGVLLDF